MSRTFRWRAATIAVVACLLAPLSMADQKACGGDDKTIGDTGLIRLSTVVAGDTWWGLIYAGLDDAGITTDQGKLDFLNALLGVGFTRLDQMAEYEVALASQYDRNGNLLICAASLRGVRTSFGDPNYARYYFSLWDDKLFPNSK